MPTILVTGAGGFIGSYIVEEAIRGGFTTWAGVRHSTNLEYLTDPNIQFIDLPFHKPKELREKLLEHYELNGSWDYIVHNLGATKARNEREFERINYDFCKNFIEALKDLDMQPRLFIYLSSLSVIGLGDETGKVALSSLMEPKPTTAYGRSKLKMENYIRDKCEMAWVILRPTGVYGPRERDYYMMMKSIKLGLNFSIGRNKQWLSFIYVTDLVKAIFTAIDNKCAGKTYILSDGNCYSNNEFAIYVKRELGKRVMLNVTLPINIVKWVSSISEIVSNIFDKSSTLNRDKFEIMRQRNWNCDMSDFINDTNFKPEVDLQEGVKRSVKWYLANKWL
ncbi:MAG: NAD-dependent epimerase/dehydratase family protein [Bacteroidales bacterium]